MKKSFKENLPYIIMSVLGLSIILQGFTSIRLRTDLNNANSEIQYLRREIQNITNEQGNFRYEIEEKIKKEASILDSVQVDFASLKKETLTVPIKVNITPKEYTENTTAKLLVNDKTYDMTKSESIFTAEVEVNVFDNIEGKVIFDENGVKKTETVQELFISDLKDKYLFNIYGGFAGQSSLGGGSYTINGSYEFGVDGGEHNKVIGAEFITEINGKKVYDRTYLEDAILTGDSMQNKVNKIDEKWDIKVGDEITTYLLVKDSYGLTYKYLYDNFIINNDGQYLNKDEYQYNNMVVEIRDENDNIVWQIKDNEMQKY